MRAKADISALADMDERERRFRAVYEPNYRPVLAYALRRSGAGEADDVVAETFAIAWRRLDDVPAGEAALPWLYGVARRVLANRRRGDRRRDRLVQRLAAEPDSATGEPAAADAPAILAALADLRPVEREIVCLAAWEGLSNARIAELFGCSENAVAIRLHRARRRLAAVLKDRELAGQEEK